jgi:hypothetical protein
MSVWSPAVSGSDQLVPTGAGQGRAGRDGRRDGRRGGRAPGVTLPFGA